MVQKTKTKLNEIWLIPGLLIIILAITFISFPSMIFNPAIFNHRPAITGANPCANTNTQHEPIYLREGRVGQITDSEIVLNTKPIPSELIDTFKVLITPETPVVEIRVPSYLNEDLKKKATAGGQLIERVPVSLKNIYPGQKIFVLSSVDTFCQYVIEPVRITYDVLIDTETP